jgi:hypothetical protein
MPHESGAANRIGLCATCTYVRIVNHPRGGEDYYRCGKHDEDPSYPKYPPLPVRSCAGYNPKNDE